MSRRRRAPPTPSPDEVVDLLDALAHAGGLDVPPGLPFETGRSGAPSARELYLEESGSFYDVDDTYAAIEREVERLAARLEPLSVAAEARWGSPAVCERDLRQPLDIDAPSTFAEERWLRGFVRLRGWRRGLPERVLWLGVEHQDKELPVVLLAGVTVWPGPLRAAAPARRRKAKPKVSPRRRAR